MLKEITDPVYPQQNGFIDFLLTKTQLKNDAALCRLLDVKPPVVSKMRHGRHPVSPFILLRVHDATGIPLPELRAHIAARAGAEA